jgi:hypothetical protein
MRSISSGRWRNSPASGRGQTPFVSCFQKRYGVPSASMKMCESITPPLIGGLGRPVSGAGG